MPEPTKIVQTMKVSSLADVGNAGGFAAVAEDIGRSLLVYGRRISKAELFARLDAVDAATVRSSQADHLQLTAELLPLL